ncbi:MAG: ABC transporter ATP-binding protein [Ruminococcaceae bacterium]|nr:ABC transporter ATP-binding protein [Oscillospiraceae bacterium]
MKWVLTYLRPLRSRIAVGTSVKIIGTLTELMIPFLLSYILEHVIVRNKVGEILLFGGLMAACAVIACIGNIVANRMAAKTTMLFSAEMRRKLFFKTLSLSAESTDRFTVPSLEARITSDTYNVQNFVGMMQRMGIRAPILLLGGTAITMVMDSKLALVMLATLPLIFVVVYGVSRMGVPLYAGVQRSVDGMVRVVREDAQGIRVIKALSKVDYENRRYDKANRALKQNETKAGVIMGVVNPIMTLLMNLGIVAVIAVSAYFVANGSSSATTVIAFMQYFTLISMAMMSLSRMFVMYTKCAASAGRIALVMEKEDELTVCEDDGKGDPSYHVSFEQVSFSYLGKRKDLRDISFSLKKGETLGIIGATGSGKSTILRLLMRFYDADSGRIRIRGKDVRSYTKDELTSLFGVVFQNDFLYADTIEENIRFGREISTEDIAEAAKVAQAHEFITAFPDGYAHEVTAGGTNLSGGQRQRLLISRAVAGRPEILILDDSSSALDYRTDANLRRALSESFPDTTVITVAQRVSSVKSCDLILVVEEGAILGCGKHEELMASCPEYKEISDSQMGGAFLDG